MCILLINSDKNHFRICIQRRLRVLISKTSKLFTGNNYNC